MIIVGIDPGTTGAAAFVHYTGRVIVRDLPTVPMQHGGRTKRKLDAAGLAEMLRECIRAIDPSDDVLFVVEDVQVMPSDRSGRSANSSLLHTKGVIEGVIGAGRHTCSFVGSRTWKKVFGLTSDKDDARDVATKLYPSMADAFKRVKDHNRAEALLIAHWGLKHLT